MPDGTYQVTLHFADIYRATHAIGARVFDVLMEGFGVFKDVDIFSEVGGFAPLTRSAPVSVSDGALTIEFLTVKENPKISAIAVEASQSVKAHHAHAGAGGPYYQYDTDGNNVASVEVDGTFSLTREWREARILEMEGEQYSGGDRRSHDSGTSCRSA